MHMYLMFFYQLALTFLIAMIWFLLGDMNSSLSLFCGSVAWILPSLLGTKMFFKNVFPPKYQQTPLHLIKNFYQSELTKLLLSAFLVVLFITLFPFLKISAFLIGYIIATLTLWFQPFFLKFKADGSV